MKTTPALIAAALLLGFIVREATVPAPEVASRPQSQPPAEASSPQSQPPAEASAGESWSSRLREAAGNSAAAGRLLDILYHHISTHRRPESIALLQQLLEQEPSGGTGQQWQWDEIEGRPVSIPGLRATLLAWLSELSADAAVPFTSGIFQSANASAEDWAVALHSLLRDNAGGQHTARIREASCRLFQRADFLTAPTPGLLDALALTAVCGGQAEFINLTELCGSGLGEGLEQAAETAALHMLQTNPLAVLHALAEDSDLLTRAPLVRARLASAVRPADQEQEALLADYWNRADLSPEERQAYSSVATFGGGAE